MQKNFNLYLMEKPSCLSQRFENVKESLPRSFSQVGIIGYGNQGRAQALNLRDTNFPVHIFLRQGGKSEQQAKEDGFAPHPIGETIQEMDLVFLLTPDHTHREVSERIYPYLRPGRAIGFAHGFSVHYREVQLPEFVDVILVAPKAVGWAVRESFLSKKSFPCVLAVHQNTSRSAEQKAEEYARLIGAGPIFWSTFQQETETDLFTEQVLLVGGLVELIYATCEILMENGVAPELAYLETIGELKYLIQLLREKGIGGMMQNISPMAQFGAFTRGPRVVDSATREQMRRILQEIRSGAFYEEWKSQYSFALDKYQNHPLEKVYQKLQGGGKNGGTGV